MIKYRTYFSKGKCRFIRLYGVWCGIKQRAIGNGKDNKNYKDRGITLCDEWLDFFKFRKWALANGYRKGLTIERVDNDGIYCPENCTFVAKSQQGKNTRRLVKYTHNGQTLSIAQWSRRIGITHAAMRYRILNWLPERAFRVK